MIDHSGASLGEYEDVSKVEKYSISQEAYDQRQGMGHLWINGACGSQKECVQVGGDIGGQTIDRDIEGKLVVRAVRGQMAGRCEGLWEADRYMGKRRGH